MQRAAEELQQSFDDYVAVARQSGFQLDDGGVEITRNRIARDVSGSAGGFILGGLSGGRRNG